MVYVWVYNLVLQIEEGTQAETFGEQDAEYGIWAQEGRGNRGEEETIYRGVLLPVLLTGYHSGDKMKKNEMGGACNAYG